VLGAGRTAAYLDVDGFVVTLTTSEVPLLPNAIRLAARAGALTAPARGSRARLAGGLIQAEGLTVHWDAARPPLWEPRALICSPGDRPAVLARAAALSELSSQLEVGLLDADPSAATAAQLLWQAVAGEDGTALAQAAEALIGRGGGLTPEGDDLLAGTVATVLAWAPAFGRATPPVWLTALPFGDIRRRTTAISATLLELALSGCAAEPLAAVLDVKSGDGRWQRDWRLLLRVGHSTGPALALAAARTASNLLSSQRHQM